MRPLLLASVSVAALFIGSQANAADLPVKARPMVVPAPVYSWTGCYVGVHGGGGWGRNRHNQEAVVAVVSSGPVLAFPGTVDSSGGLFGGQVGCNYQLAGNWVVGAQGDIAAADISGRNLDPIAVFFGDPGTIGIKSDWLASATVRLGYAFAANRALLYVKGGGAWIHNKWDLSFADAHYFPSTVSETRAGWTFGGGFEYMLTQNWTVFVEGNYYDFGKGKLLEVSPSDPAAFYSGKQTVETVKIGVNYKFGWDAPVVAKY
ncbi:MAG: porin family protein [Bradyrhizobium sp.]|uniref:outer membrane protein n=1 Tax=Bradyrhizobium sp. TaxID=376 RepID=UPI001213AC09|nr:outer membrane beta-barrel protein [Bradyrhizobium sp.]THD72725.1 MAG: porin family protein [Bradyrhizobium sp.]